MSSEDSIGVEEGNGESLKRWANADTGEDFMLLYVHYLPGGF